MSVCVRYGAEQYDFVNSKFASLHFASLRSHLLVITELRVLEEFHRIGRRIVDGTLGVRRPDVHADHATVLVHVLKGLDGSTGLLHLLLALATSKVHNIHLGRPERGDEWTIEPR